jgi:hypothetical protein
MAGAGASRPLCAAFFAGCWRLAELAHRAARAEERDFVLTVVVEVDEVSLPAGRGSGRAPLALAADKHRRHNAIIA